MATSLSRKLRLQPGQRALVLNVPDNYRELVDPLPEDLELSDNAEGTFDFVHLFVQDSAELDRWGPIAIKAVRYDGLLWLSYPKKSAKVETDLSRDRGWDLLAEAGLRPVTQISVDEIWSALRWRPVGEVKARSG